MAYALLVRLARLEDFVVAAAEGMGSRVQLEVAWCTHKYKQTQEDDLSEIQEAKGSGARTHFHLVARGSHRESVVGVLHAYHTTMWFEATFPASASDPCLSSRLLLSWGPLAPTEVVAHIENMWE